MEKEMEQPQPKSKSTLIQEGYEKYLKEAQAETEREKKIIEEQFKAKQVEERSTFDGVKDPQTAINYLKKSVLELRDSLGEHAFAQKANRFVTIGDIEEQ